MSLPTAVLAYNSENDSDVLSLYTNPVDSQSDLIGHDGFQKLNAMRDLLVEYNTTLKHMQAMYDAVMRNRHDESWRMCCDSGDNSIKHTLAVENLFCIERARCSLDEKYWQKLLDLTGVKPLMPTDRYDHWNEGLRAWRKSPESNFKKLKPVPFNEESIFSTAFALNEEKKITSLRWFMVCLKSSPLCIRLTGPRASATNSS